MAPNVLKSAVVAGLVGMLIALSACASSTPSGISGPTIGSQKKIASSKRTNCHTREQFSFVRGRGIQWHGSPDVVILARSDDSRIKLTRESVDYWNRQFAEIGSSFRLGRITREPISYAVESYMPDVSRSVLVRRRGLPKGAPPSLSRFCGHIVIVLADNRFISFAKVVGRLGMLLVGIKGEAHHPLDRPNVARNVIAHEFGHAIGLFHNADPTKLMCGRPASCRPTAFESTTARFFPLTNRERKVLLEKYPRH